MDLLITQAAARLRQTGTAARGVLQKASLTDLAWIIAVVCGVSLVSFVAAIDTPWKAAHGFDVAHGPWTDVIITFLVLGIGLCGWAFGQALQRRRDEEAERKSESKRLERAVKVMRPFMPQAKMARALAAALDPETAPPTTRVDASEVDERLEPMIARFMPWLPVLVSFNHEVTDMLFLQVHAVREARFRASRIVHAPAVSDREFQVEYDRAMSDLAAALNGMADATDALPWDAAAQRVAR